MSFLGLTDALAFDSIVRDLKLLSKQPETVLISLSSDDEAYTLSAGLPGWSRGAVDISVQDGEITIASKERDETNPMLKEFKIYHIIPTDASNEISAKLEAGLLTVTLSRSGKEEARSIPVE